MLHHRQKKKIEDLDVKEKKMMKAPFYLYLQLGHFISRTAIEAEILFEVCLIKKQALTGGKSLARENKYSKKIGAESVVLHFVFFMIIINKMQQSAKTKLLLNSPTDMPFGNRWSRYKEPSKNKAEAYRVYVEHLFLRSDAGDARIFSKDDEQAQRVYIKYGNGVETRYKYDEKRRWLDTIETKNNQTQDVFQKIKYSFDPVGNVLGYNNDASTYETKQEYKYDNLYQLISVEGTSNQYKAKKSSGTTPVSIAKYKQTFAFDGIGNMKEKLSTTNIPGAQGNSYPKAELDYNLDYEYDPAYAHRLIRAGTRYYRYDANGNITAEKDGPFTDEEEFVFTYSYFEEQDVYGADYGFGLDAPKETEQSNPQDLFAYRRNYTWNERNLLTKSSDRNFTVHYRYGDDGQRALKYTDEGRSETLYFNNFFTIHIPTQDQNNPQGLRVHKHIFVGNSRLVTAMTHTDNYGDNDEQKAKRYYYHSDHLGSAQFVTDWKGRQYEHIEYTPYGELWIEEVAAGLDKLPFRFTGKELDEETGLYYYGARYLDPKYSRWLSGDPALNDYIPKAPIDDEAKKHNENLPGMGGVFNTVNLHVYHYAGNNPVKYTDPDGEKTFDGRWWSRNWDNLLSLGFNVFEVVAGVSISTATGVTGAGAFMGGLMIIHGGANSIASIGKIMTTSLAADMYGDDYADNLDSIMPDTALGFIGYGLGLMAETVTGFDAYGRGHFAEKVGALGDLLDVACGFVISGNAGKNLNNAIKGFMKSSGKYISKADLFKLQKYLQQANKNSALKIINGILENYDRLTSSQSNLEQLVE